MWKDKQELINKMWKWKKREVSKRNTNDNWQCDVEKHHCNTQYTVDFVLAYLEIITD